MCPVWHPKKKEKAKGNRDMQLYEGPPKKLPERVGGELGVLGVKTPNPKKNLFSFPYGDVLDCESLDRTKEVKDSGPVGNGGLKFNWLVPKKTTPRGSANLGA